MIVEQKEQIDFREARSLLPVSDQLRRQAALPGSLSEQVAVQWEYGLRFSMRFLHVFHVPHSAQEELPG